MRKWIMKLLIMNLAEPIMDTIIDILEKLAMNTKNEIDDIVVNTLKRYKKTILDYVLRQIEEITKRSK